MGKRKLSRQQRWRIEKVQAERAKRADRQQQHEEQALADEDYGPDIPGRVIAHFGRSLELQARDGRLYRCHLRANLEPLVTGDRVTWRKGRDDSGVVVARNARDNVLERPDPRGLLKPVAANIDQILVVFAVEPAPFANLIDRYLVAAEATGITPVLVLNKIDLAASDHADLHALLAPYRQLGYPVVGATARTENGLDALHERLEGRTSVFVGQSGVGKSSLIDRLLPGEALRIGALSGDARKGTHTTTTARLYALPAGGELIDSPGVREFGLTHLDEHQVAEGFREFRPLLGHCRFRDCRHRNEPGCALLAAWENGTIAPQRFASYRRILESLDVG